MKRHEVPITWDSIAYLQLDELTTKKALDNVVLVLELTLVAPASHFVYESGAAPWWFSLAGVGQRVVCQIPPARSRLSLEPISDKGMDVVRATETEANQDANHFLPSLYQRGNDNNSNLYQLARLCRLWKCSLMETLVSCVNGYQR